MLSNLFFGVITMQRHLAVFREPFLSLIFSGAKTMESRFSNLKCAPYERVAVNDVVVLKKTGSLVVGEFTVSDIMFFDLRETPIAILDRYLSSLAIDKNSMFWQVAKNKRYVSLMWIRDVKRYESPYSYPKKDRRGWILL